MSGTAGGGALRLRVQGLAPPSLPPRGGGCRGEPGGWNPSAGAAKQVSGSRRRGRGRAGSCGRGHFLLPAPLRTAGGSAALPAAIWLSRGFLLSRGPSCPGALARSSPRVQPAPRFRRDRRASGPAPAAPSPPLGPGSSGTCGSAVGSFLPRESRRAATPPERPASGRLPRAPATSSGALGGLSRNTFLGNGL